MTMNLRSAAQPPLVFLFFNGISSSVVPFFFSVKSFNLWCFFGISCGVVVVFSIKSFRTPFAPGFYEGFYWFSRLEFGAFPGLWCGDRPFRHNFIFRDFWKANPRLTTKETP